MTDRKKAVVIGGVVLSILGLLLFVGNIAGCGPHRYADRDDDSWSDHKHKHSKFWAGRFQEHIENHLDEKVEELDLSESQKEQYEEIKQELVAKLKQGFKKRKEFMKEIEIEINNENPDLNAVAAMVKQKLSEFPAIMEGHMDLILSFYNMLDEEQQEKVIEEIREKMERHHRRFSAFTPPFKAG